MSHNQNKQRSQAPAQAVARASKLPQARTSPRWQRTRGATVRTRP
jgi:hypothetical protein